MLFTVHSSHAFAYGMNIMYAKFSFISGKYVNFDDVILSDEAYLYTYGIVLFFTQVRLLRLLRFNRKMSLVGATLKRMGSSFITCFFIMIVLLVSFGFLATHLFQTESPEFRSLPHAILYLFTSLLGHVNIFFIVVTGGILWCYTSIFISLICNAFMLARHDITQIQNDVEFVDFVWSKLKDLMSFSKRVSEKDCFRA